MAAAWLIPAAQADAALILVTSRPALGAPQENLNWNVLGPAFTNVSNPFTINSAPGGIPVQVSQTAGLFQRRDQNNGWSGNFAPGAPLLWDNNNGPVVALRVPGGGALSGGAKIQADFFGAFTAKLEAFDTSGVSLGFVTENGNSTPNGDDSAIFLGVLSTGAAIGRFEFSLTSAVAQPNDFAINQFSFVLAPVPEPGTIAVIGLIGVCALGAARFRRGKNVP
jgi:hypothetical protein